MWVRTAIHHHMRIRKAVEGQAALFGFLTHNGDKSLAVGIFRMAEVRDTYTGGLRTNVERRSTE